eukprot:TRINITY_DN31587_c0_g1_i1.p1 TRINITY_DN31587_c0_g1~~TRINITY_DN31587_c0_g1_i1.p1  ORF type:complete len:593 (-),score=127.14 TRINITY_DN31587_c0_g1_i1:376-2154(-)
MADASHPDIYDSLPTEQLREAARSHLPELEWKVPYALNAISDQLEEPFPKEVQVTLNNLWLQAAKLAKPAGPGDGWWFLQDWFIKILRQLGDDFVGRTRATERGTKRSTQSLANVYHVRAMLTSMSTVVPICRHNWVCVVDRAQLTLWRFADAGLDDFEGHMLRTFFKSIWGYLPPYARWMSPWHCPSILYKLEGKATWPLDTLPRDSAIYRLVMALRSQFADVAEDLETGVLSDEGRKLIRDPAWTGLHQNGTWRAFVVYRTGGFVGRFHLPRQLDPNACRFVPRTCRILEETRALPGAMNFLPTLQGSQEVVDFLSSEPGTRVSSHSASSNGRLAVQLCLRGCNDEETLRQPGRGSYLKAGSNRLYWRYGEPIVFDDSYIHSVYTDPDLPARWVLLVQMMHPSIDTPEKFSNYFAYHAAGAGDQRESANIEEGGPPPPPLEEEDGNSVYASGLSFVNDLHDTVVLYHALWGPVSDGPRVLLGEFISVSRGGSKEVGDPTKAVAVSLPPLAHRSLLVATNISDGKDIAVWRIDARPVGMRRFRVPVEAEELNARAHELHARWMHCIEECDFWELKVCEAPCLKAREGHIPG